MSFLFIARLKLIVGATAIGFAPIFAKLLILDGAVSPIASGFWRMFVGAIGFCLLTLFQGGPSKPSDEVVKLWRDSRGLAVLAGGLFAADLMAWHTSFLYTSVGVSSLIANLSAVFVPAAGILFFKESIKPNILTGGMVAFLGFAGLTLFKPDQASRDLQGSLPLLGEVLAFMTAFFYTAYMISIKSLAGKYSSIVLMMVSSVISAVILGLVCAVAGQDLVPKTGMGWVWATCVGLISQVMGQGLVAKSLAVLPVGQSALMLLWAPISAAIFGWLVFNEAMTTGQALSMAVMVIGIGIVAKR